MLHSFPVMFLSLSFHVYSFPLIFRSHYFHVHSNVHSCPFIFLSSSFHLHACSFHFACMSLFLLKFWKWLYGWPGNRVQQMVIAKVIALSLNNPSNIWHCSREIWNLPQKQQSEREREKANNKRKERKKERERASEFDAKWYGKQGTTGWILSSVLPVNVHNSIYLVYAKFNGLSCMVPGYRFWGGPIALQRFVHISDKNNSCTSKWSTILTVTIGNSNPTSFWIFWKKT